VTNAREINELHRGAHRGARREGLAILRVLPVALSTLGFLACAFAPLALGGCDGDIGGGPDGGPNVDDFEDHTLDRIDSVADFDAIGAAAPSSTALKFIITRFQTGQQRAVFLEPSHYALHDEWYWFRLLNGAAIDGVDTAPVDPSFIGGPYETIAEIVTWARAQPPGVLPLDLQFVSDGRLYSPRFYALALSEQPKQLGIGTILHFRARPDVPPPLGPLPEQWAMELEFQHQLTAAELAQFFLALDDKLPLEIKGQLKLLVRSSQQETLAQQLEAEGSPLAERILRYSDVTVPGETEVYSEGLVAGRLKIVRAGESFDDARSSDILVTEEMPDFLPQCAALITAVPQTALAHVNILAKNRGIPNAYRGAVLDDPELDQLARVRAPVIVKAVGPDQMQIVAMTESEFAQFRALQIVPPTAVPPIDLTGIEYAYDLTSLDFVDEETWRPVLGGKSFGFIGLVDAAGNDTVNGAVTLPLSPVGLSIRGYIEHTASMRAQLESMLIDPTFASDVNVRILVLEGPNVWRERHPEDPSFPERFLATRGAGDTLRALVEGGGVKEIIEDTPMDATVLDAYVAQLDANFGAYADTQKLRFRSSSNVEDAEGFIGAGLYESFSGSLRPTSSSERTVEEAIKKVWATYWGVEAFEERKLANVAHLSGSMGVAVHASFQDELELSNAVVTYTILPPGHPEGDRVMEVNAQQGALSVTNPPPGDPNLPEAVRVIQRGALVDVDRLRGSTLMPRSFVLSDDQYRDVFAQIGLVTQQWLDHENAALPASQERSTLTLDLEIREVDEGWPALANGNLFASRVVVKQARLLEPLTARVSPSVQSMPIPRDVLGRALRVEQRRCVSALGTVTLTDVFTDARKKPDLGFTHAPFTSFFVVDFAVDVPAVGATAGQRRSSVHTGFTATHPGMTEASSAYAVNIAIDEGNVATLGMSRLAVDAGGVITFARDADSASAPSECTAEILFASPEAFLEGILASR
jgi:hypothetical protein